MTPTTHQGATLAERLAAVQSRIVAAAKAASRDPASVLLLAVSKGHDVFAIRKAYELGVRDFGESYVQEWVSKREALADLTDLRWHFIGHLQSNKAKFLVSGVSLLHSVDRTNIAEVLERLHLRSEDRPGTMRVLVEMEVDPEDENKGGISLGDVAALCKLLCACQELEWCGFMGMGPLGKSDDELKVMYGNFVGKCRALWAGCGRSGDPIVSLGMSDDLEVAIATGSTMVRIGTALFGERSYT